jgi:hypothetical protein
MSFWDDESELSCLIQAFTNLVEAKKQRDKCYEECQCSPGYHCSRENDAVRDAEAELGNYLGKVIDKRVLHILSKVLNKSDSELKELIDS